MAEGRCQFCYRDIGAGHDPGCPYYVEKRAPRRPRPRKGKKLTYNQRRALQNVLDGLPAGNHVRGQSQAGGFTATMLSLLQAGLLTRDHELTDKGRHALTSGRVPPVWPLTDTA